MSQKLAFLASDADVARDAHARLVQMYGSVDLDQADIIVALGGDGFMLQTLHATQHLDAPVYGMNRGTVGFLMNAYEEDGLIDRLSAAEEAEINPLSMTAVDV
ncbi:MAG: NAD kinase, partial [Rhodobacteraceae bacterium]|nr:NAD kinase [Paracoccaceae bacterium]